MKSLSSKQEEIEEIIIQGLGHQERRSILRIISLAEDGASYGAILGELGLNTGRMNYHLGQLQGLIVRDGDRKYRLTPLGQKALSTLHSMTQNLENGYEEYLNSAKATREDGIANLVNRWFYVCLVFTVSALLFLAYFVHMAVTSGMLPQASYYYLAAFTPLVVGLLVWFKRWTKRESERAQDWFNSIVARLTGRHR